LAEAKEELKTCSYIKIWRSQFKSGYWGISRRNWIKLFCPYRW
jgi:hypothetical protein